MYQQANIDTWAMSFVDEDGRQIGLRVQPDLFREKELPRLRDELAGMLAERMAARLDFGVPWMPGVDIHRDGLYFPESDEPPVTFSEPLVLEARNGSCSLRQGNRTHEWPMDSLNFYPGLLLIQRLCPRQ